MASQKNWIATATTFDARALKSATRIEADRYRVLFFDTLYGVKRQDPVPALRGDRTATSLLPALLDRGFLASDTSYGDVRFAIPDHALRFYFPAFWPEAEQEQATLAAQEQA